MPFYKSNHIDVLKACASYERQTHFIDIESKAFAKMFGAKPVFHVDTCGQNFYGLKFSPVLASPLWTTPCALGTQAPRSTLPSEVVSTSTPETVKRLQDQLRRLNLKYSRRPEFKATLEPLWESLGTNWGSLFLNGVSFFAFDDTLYIYTDANLNDRATLIPESEYTKAREVARG